jgi:hypothetical protein
MRLRCLASLTRLLQVASLAPRVWLSPTTHTAYLQ